MKNVIKYNDTIFENIKHIDENGNEYWFARELQVVLDYKEWRNFKKVIDKAIKACINSGLNLDEQLINVNKLLKRNGNNTVTIQDYKLSRYICYLIVQNADPKKEAVALGKTYLAVQTRKKELEEKEYNFSNVENEELISNLFIISQTKQKLLKENIKEESKAKKVYYEVSKTVRKAIADIAGNDLRKVNNI